MAIDANSDREAANGGPIAQDRVPETRIPQLLEIMTRQEPAQFIAPIETRLVWAALYDSDPATPGRRAAGALAAADARASFSATLAILAPLKFECDCENRYDFSTCVSCLSFEKPIRCLKCLNSSKKIWNPQQKGGPFGPDSWDCDHCLDHGVLECCPDCNGLGHSSLERDWERCICQNPFTDCRGLCAPRGAPRLAAGRLCWVPKPNTVCATCMGLGGLCNSDAALSPARDVAHRQRAAVYNDREALIHAALIWDLCKLRVKLAGFKTRFCGNALETASHLLGEVLSIAERARDRGAAVAAAEAAGFNVAVDRILKSTDQQMLEIMEKTRNWENQIIIENSRRPLLRYLRHLDYDLSDLVGTKEPSSAAGLRACLDSTFRGQMFENMEKTGDRESQQPLLQHLHSDYDLSDLDGTKDPNSAAGLRACGIDVEDGASCLDFTIRGYKWRLIMYVYLMRRASFALNTGKIWHKQVSRIFWEPVPTLSMLLENLALCHE
ncbi:MAG: hypothetical protein EBS05_25340 [Proteobacteria bacterium]|nr:hypothetical protein [Pseudomonadota bacterium]